jgi:hypothetical protein
MSDYTLDSKKENYEEQLEVYKNEKNVKVLSFKINPDFLEGKRMFVTRENMKIVSELEKIGLVLTNNKKIKVRKDVKDKQLEVIEKENDEKLNIERVFTNFFINNIRYGKLKKEENESNFVVFTTTTFLLKKIFFIKKIDLSNVSDKKDFISEINNIIWNCFLNGEQYYYYFKDTNIIINENKYKIKNFPRNLYNNNGKINDLYKRSLKNSNKK